MPDSFPIEQLSVGVIGGGIAGGTAARLLHQRGFSVTVFDKARGPGGRCSTRRGDGVAFDHGAQVFCPRSPALDGLVTEWHDAGVIEPWNGRHVRINDGLLEPADDRTRWVGVPGMNALVKHALADLDVRFNHRIESIQLDEDGWLVQTADAEPCGRFDRIILAVPADQAAPLLAEASPNLSGHIDTLPMEPRWAVMLSVDAPLELPFDSAEINGHSSLGWLARNSAKPGRPASPPECWVLMASRHWSMEHVEKEFAWVAEQLTDDLHALCEDYGVKSANHEQPTAHRWRFGFPGEVVGEPFIMDGTRTLACVGDWLLGDRIEHALESGIAAADAMSMTRTG